MRVCVCVSGSGDSGGGERWSNGAEAGSLTQRGVDFLLARCSVMPSKGLALSNGSEIVGTPVAS